MSKFKKDFPVFDSQPDLVYLDTAASAQKLGVVVDGVRDFSINSYANVHRGLYELAESATAKYESAREKVANFIGAERDEVVFVRNATEGINLVAWSWALKNLKEGDVVVLSVADHHANVVPWLELQKTIGIEIEWIGLNADGFVDEEALMVVLGSRTGVRLVSLFHVSNVLGQKLDVGLISRKCSEIGAKFLVDACQSVVHENVDVKEINCDFLVFSGHKLYGPSGIGVLYVKKDLLCDADSFPAFLGGGDAIESVAQDGVVFKKNYERFEAGTPAIEAAYGLGIACDYLREVDREFEKEIVKYLEESLLELDFVDVIGLKVSGIREGLVSFNVKGVHAHDVAHILGENGVAVRAGQHCAHPLHSELGVSSTVRASIGLYNDMSDVDALVDALKKVYEMFN